MLALLALGSGAIRHGLDNPVINQLLAVEVCSAYKEKGCPIGISGNERDDRLRRVRENSAVE
jgi:hypothetical protein